MVRNKKKIIRTCTVPMSIEFFDELMIRLRNKGFEMTAISSPGPELDRLSSEGGFKCYGVPMSRHISPLNDLKSLLSLIRVFAKESPYIVHSITPKAGLLSMIAAFITRVPIRIHTFTGLVWPTSKGIKRKVLIATDWLTCACASHVIPEGYGILNDLKNARITNKPMKVLGYGNVKGVDLERFKPGRFNIIRESNVFTYIFVGRIVGDKGINELVEAFARIYQKYPNTKLLLVGNYEEELDPLLATTKNKIDTIPSILYRGVKYGDDLIAEYLSADCFVLPSYREGFPNTVIEAGALGLPSIVTDINGSREIITDGTNGFIVPTRDPESLFLAMERIMVDEKNRNKMSTCARPIIESRYDKKFVQDCLIDFYNEVLK